MSTPVLIDGSKGEGGGQVLRTSLSLAATYSRPMEISNVRGGRPKPGLQAQHLAAVRAAGAICGARMKGDSIGSTYLYFEPTTDVKPGEYAFDIGTAGSTTLIAQTLIVPLSLAGRSSRVTITGGTHNPLAPTADYLDEVYASTLREHGYVFRVGCEVAGFYPKGAGRLVLEIDPAPARLPFSIISQGPGQVRARIVSNNLDDSIAKRGADVLTSHGIPVEVRTAQAVSTGVAVTLFANKCGFSSLGERGKPMERVVKEALGEYRRWSESGRAVDEHLADQLVLPALFASDSSKWRTHRLTDHLRTVLWVSREFGACDFEIDEGQGEISVTPLTSSLA